MTHVKLSGQLEYPDAKGAAEALARTLEGRADDRSLAATRVDGTRLVFAFDGQVDGFDRANHGVRAALQSAVRGEVVLTRDGTETRLTALGRDFWQKRWDDGQIGFHEGKPNELLERHFGALGLAAGSRVLVPLAGKAVDLAWIAGQGHEVLGIELSRTAIEAFFTERGLDPKAAERPLGANTAFVTGSVTLVCADVFALDLPVLGRFDAVYDRAALVALEPSTRSRYLDVCRSLLKPSGSTLLVSFAYDPPTVPGPPWSIDEPTVRELFASERVTVLERRDSSISPRLQAAGVKTLNETAYRIQRG
jgi:thiopurine S-methyltransferase